MQLRAVAPFTGAWIEIFKKTGIKHEKFVAPFTGAWIEIRGFRGFLKETGVAPFTGAWIEIEIVRDQIPPLEKSHPSRVRGLKFGWFERRTAIQSRTLHGCVD